MQNQIMKVTMTTFFPIYKNSDGKVLSEEEVDSIEKLNKGFLEDDEHQNLISIDEDIKERETETTMINMGTYWMMLSRDEKNTYTSMEMSNNPGISYKLKETPDEFVAKFKESNV